MEVQRSCCRSGSTVRIFIAYSASFVSRCNQLWPLLLAPCNWTYRTLCWCQQSGKAHYTLYERNNNNTHCCSTRARCSFWLDAESLLLLSMRDQGVRCTCIPIGLFAWKPWFHLIDHKVIQYILMQSVTCTNPQCDNIMDIPPSVSLTFDDVIVRALPQNIRIIVEY